MKRGRPRDREEREFLERYDAAAFPHPSVTVDVALVTVSGGRLRALLIRRDRHPDKDRWSLPGGFVRMDESLDFAALRVLREKAGVEGVFLEQLYTLGQPDRDPRTRVITVVYYALVDSTDVGLPAPPEGGIRFAEIRVPWGGDRGGMVGVLDERERLLDLAFDHAEILGLVVKRLRGKLDYAPIGFELLPEEFTLLQLQRVHEVIRGGRVDKASFRRRMLDSGQLLPSGRRERGVGHRPAEFYTVRAVPRAGWGGA